VLRLALVEVGGGSKEMKIKGDGKGKGERMGAYHEIWMKIGRNLSLITQKHGGFFLRKLFVRFLCLLYSRRWLDVHEK